MIFGTSAILYYNLLVVFKLIFFSAVFKTYPINFICCWKLPIIMKCPYCNNEETQVIDTRDTENLEATRRRRECLKCNKRFTTYERVEETEIVVVKKDGKRERFERQKVINGILKACEKRNIPLEKIEKLVDED